jgi:Na+/phosphate symporter
LLFYEIAFSAIGGLGMFLFGMQIMASGLQKAAGVIYLDILSNLERVADHANNIADLVAENKL